MALQYLVTRVIIVIKGKKGIGSQLMCGGLWRICN